MSRFASVLWPGLVVLAAGCGDGNGTTEPPPAPSIDEQLRQRIQGAGVIPVGAMPAQNPAQAELGQALFFDPLLSGNRDIACATCHNPLTHGGDGLSLAIRSEEHTSELQSRVDISYAVFCLKKKNTP